MSLSRQGERHAAPSDAPGAEFTPQTVASGTERAEVTAALDGVYWLEHSFDEGRSQVMHVLAGGAARGVTPAGVDVGTLAWEYGGGSFLITPTGIVYSDRSDQRLYRVTTSIAATPLTPIPSIPLGERFADGSASPDGRWAAYVRESHRPGETVSHALVAVDLERLAEPRTLARGEDFYMAPRLSPDGSRLAWISWRKPRMPWDGTELWAAGVRPDLTLADAHRVAGGERESVLAPAWSPDGTLHWISDRSGWWNLYALHAGSVRPVCPEPAEFAVAPWQYGRRSYGFLPDATIIAVRVSEARHELVRIAGAGVAEPLNDEITWVTDGHLSCAGRTVALAAATPSADLGVVTLDPDSGRMSTVAADPPAHDASLISVGRTIRIPGRDGAGAYGFWYEPAARGDGPPPLMLHLHGGPTDAAQLAFDPELQLWTSRGFALLDLNYSGSTGFGSGYRRRLDGAWGERDLADCDDAVAHLIAEGLVDPDRVYVRGASAGGFLTLRCLTATSAFAGGMARCGIADLALWREDAHDFESRYTDMLIGPPSRADAYRQRSPALNVGPAAAPLLLIHGLEDRVVPPEHSRRMAAAYSRAGRPHGLELLAGEPHGLRQANSRQRWLTAELRFISCLEGINRK